MTQKESPGVRQVNRQQLAAGNPECWMALGIIDDLQQELPVVIIDFLSSQCTIIIHRQQIPPIHLKRRRHIHKTCIKIHKISKVIQNAQTDSEYEASVLNSS